MKFLSAEHVSFSYKKQGPEVLSDISFSAERGHIVALLGPNGAGKTTLIDIILGWKQSDAGTVTLHGEKTSLLSRKQAGRLMSLVPQSEHMNFSFSVSDYVLFGRTPYMDQLGAPRNKDFHAAEQALRTVGLYALRTRSIQQLSGGEIQLLLLARSIAQEPALLLLDEPTSDLDPGNMAKVINILRRINSGNRTTILFTTHDPNLASELAHKVILLKNGSLLFAGAPEEGLTSELLTELYSTPIRSASVDGKRLLYRSGAGSSSTS